MRRSRTTIRKEYEQLVEAFEKVCKFLGWKLTFKQDVDKLLHVIVDGCTYFVAPQQNSTPDHPLYYLSVLVTIPGNRDEQQSEDEEVIAEGFRDPRRIITTLMDTHWREKRHWAMEQDWIESDEQEQF